MRRIYDSNAVKRDDDDPFTPGDDRRPTSSLSSGRYRTINWERVSYAFMPVALRNRAISVSVGTARPSYAPGEPVRIQVSMANRWPMPVTLRTRSAVGWTWAVDGVEEASKVGSELDDDGGLFTFYRGERKRFEREWHQSIRVDAREWEPVGPGEYTVSAAVDVPNARERGLSDETTVRIE